jgi:glutathione synthase/RimK-type ligase-like ATP-grasp enzyme
LHEATLRNLGFRVPESITSSDPDKLRAFVSEGPTISKALCGARADAVMVTDEDLAQFDPQSGPVHMQRCVPGDDARIHVVGREVIAQRVGADSVDYRRAGAISRMTVFDPPEPLRDRLIDATAALGLAFAGWDFKIDSSENYWCLEANPMPGYGPYDAYCDGAISGAVRGYLNSEST